MRKRKGKGAPQLNVEFSAITDEEGRFARLATLLGLADADHARGKCEHLWVACTRRGEFDLPQWLVEQVLGERGPESLIEVELARWSAGRGDSKTRRLRIAGAERLCMWMTNYTPPTPEQSAKGGKSRATGAPRSAGRFAPSDQPHTRDPDPDPDPIPEITLPAGARAIHIPTPGPAPAWDPERPGALGKLAEATYRAVSDARVALAAELGLPVQLPFPAITPAARPQAIRDLLERVREEGAGAPVACALVVDNLVKQARDTREITWLAAKAFTSGGWAHAREYLPGAKSTRAGPRSAPPRDVRVGAIQPHHHSEYPEGEQEIP